VVIPTLGVPIQTIYCLWFLEVKNTSPKLYKTVVGITIYFIAYALIRFFCPLKVTLAINTINALLSYFLMGYVGYKIGKKGNRLGYYFAWAYFIYFLLVLTEATYIQTGKPAYFIGLSHVGLATLIEAFIFTFLISKRFEWEKDELERMKLEATEKLLESTIENERIVKEQNAILELKVSERTAELNSTLQDLKNTQTQLVQNEKLASLGQLTAGIAHEINNPINFVSSNISPLKRDFADLETIFKRYKESGIEPNDKVLQKMITDMDIDYTFAEIKDLLKGIEEGAKRTTEIVKGLKSFSRTDEQKKSEYDITEGLDGTILLLNSKLIHKGIVVEKKYEQLPLLNCFAGKINQVFMNVISNAIDASNEKSKIKIETWCENNQVKISIADSGIGMTNEVKQKIFDPFFTTKEVGYGTGLGLSITYGIIESHNGKIEVNSEIGVGTAFIISIPLN
jgi:signal transduction histidine kinase